MAVLSIISFFNVTPLIPSSSSFFRSASDLFTPDPGVGCVCLVGDVFGEVSSMLSVVSPVSVLPGLPAALVPLLDMVYSAKGSVVLDFLLFCVGL